MNAVLRVVTIYVFLLIIFRISGKRALGQLTTFDLVLLLIISETTQNALVGTDYSVTNAIILITTFVGIDIGLSLWKHRSPRLEKLLDGVPLIIVENGRLLKERMDKERIDESDILTAARELHGLERLDQIKYAVLERNGDISIIPKQ
ncbi:MAG: YetF domain-containing protein [Acidobacteriota bacterium]